MTRIDFYILSNNEDQQRLLYCCKLAEKAFNLGHKIYIHTENEAQVAKLDELLWTFSADSFLPHHAIENPHTEDAPVSVGYQQAPDHHHDLLINLAGEIPDFFSRFDRLAEVVCQAPEQLEYSRNHWKFYRDRGYPLKSHSVTYR